MACPDENQIAVFLEGGLAGTDGRVLEQHLDTCDACRRVLAAVGKTSFAAQRLIDPRLDETQEDTDSASSGGAVEVGTRLGRYRVLAQLGAGGMSVVYAAHDPDLDRRVALKLLRPDHVADGAERLQREAQALAKLSHPNVIPVFEVGLWTDRLFMAMPLARAGTVTQWRNLDRSHREVMDLFLQAGRGLAAAHKAGLVHRDFKPDNVLITEAGQIWVTDFGLVKPAAGPESKRGQSHGGGVALTRTGALMGTPAYMAPEQFDQTDGATVDARSDQFSFCVALYEALLGERPFAGDTLPVLRDNVLAGRRSDHPSLQRLPGLWRRALLRGLQTRPEQRHDSMEDLLAILALDPHRTRKLAAVGLGLCGVAVAVGVWVGGVATDARCGRGPDRLAAIWGPAQRDAIAQAFAATGLPYAPATFMRAAARLDSYGQSWQGAYRSVCEAHSDGELSEQLLDRGMACLDERLDGLATLRDALQKADARVVKRAISVAGRLPPPEVCAQRKRLLASPGAPADPKLAQGVLELRQRLRQANVQVRTGRSREAMAPAQQLVQTATGLGYAPALAEALFFRGSVENAAGKHKAAEQTWHRAAEVAQEGGHDEMAARAWMGLVFLVGRRKVDFEQGAQWGRYAAAALKRIGGSPELEAKLEGHLGGLAQAQDQYDDARAHYGRAITMWEASFGKDHLGSSSFWNNLGALEKEVGSVDKARAHFERSLAIKERALGVDHPDIALSVYNLGALLAGSAQYEAAMPLFERALAIQTRALGAEHPRLAHFLGGIGVVHKALGRFEAAEAVYKRALAIFEKAQGPEHPNLARPLTNLGNLALMRKRLDDAERYYRRALQVREKALGKQHSSVGRSVRKLGNLALERGNAQEARRYLERALAISEARLGRDHPSLAMDLTMLGGAYERIGDRRRAVSVLERALAMRKGGKPGLRLAETQFMLASVLPRSQRKRAHKLATQARAGFTSAGPIGKQQVAEVGRWLVKHR